MDEVCCLVILIKPATLNRFDCGMFMLKYTDFYSRDIGLCFNQVKQCTAILTAALDENENDEASCSKRAE